jgi:hypothetical protein
MRLLFFFFCTILFQLILSGQDVIHLQSGRVIEVFIIEEDETQVVYRKANDSTAVRNFALSKDQIDFIEYELQEAENKPAPAASNPPAEGQTPGSPAPNEIITDAVPTDLSAAEMSTDKRLANRSFISYYAGIDPFYGDYYGLMSGKLPYRRRFGYYVAFRTSSGYSTAKSSIRHSGSRLGGFNFRFLPEEEVNEHWAITTGSVARLSKGLFLYYGLGYGVDRHYDYGYFRNLPEVGHIWSYEKQISDQGIMGESGFIVRLRGLNIVVGYATDPNFSIWGNGLKLGLGWNFATGD